MTTLVRTPRVHTPIDAQSSHATIKVMTVHSSSSADRLNISALRKRLDEMRTRGTTQSEPAPDASDTPAFTRVLNLSEVETEAGTCFVREETYPLDSTHGDVHLGPLRDTHGPALAGLLRDPSVRDYDLRSCLFIDTETNGLSGGAGTYAFLVGVGFVDEDVFRVRQFFMPDPGAEPALLAGLMPLLERYDALVSFNGKSFDVPVLETRFVMARRPCNLRERPHVDLLHPARRLWKLQLSSCALSSLERRILGLTRAEDDVPGWLVPRYYNEFLQSGDARPLRGVFYHNRQDIVSLAALGVHMVQLYQDPAPERGVSGIELYSLARLYEEGGDTDDAEAAYREALRTQLSPEIRRKAIRRLSFLLKRQERWDEATDIWRTIIGRGELYPYEELAKYWEHHARDYEKAIRAVQAAFQHGSDGKLYLTADERDALRHRRSRLRRKIENSL